MPSEDLKKYDISKELWREYDFSGRVYRIDNPVMLYMHANGTTHRVVDKDGVAHCVPIPGPFGCVLRWKNKDGVPPVNF